MPKRIFQSIDDYVSSEVDLAIHRYRELLDRLPPPGGGFNPALLPVASAARNLGMSAEEFIADLRANLKHGTRDVTDLELRRAFWKGPSDGTDTVFPKPRLNHSLLQRIIEEGKRAGPWWKPYCDMPAHEQTRNVLARLFDGHEPVWCGRTQPVVRGRVTHCAEWRAFYLRPTAPNANTHFIINPLGKPGCTKEGKPSQMADANVSDTRHLLVEFDNLDLDDQVHFWSGLDEPRLMCLTYSGGKSIHGILDVSDIPFEQAQAYFLSFYGAVGADPACRNRARQSRLAGCFNKGVLQQLLYLKGL